MWCRQWCYLCYILVHKCAEGLQQHPSDINPWSNMGNNPPGFGMILDVHVFHSGDSALFRTAQTYISMNILYIQAQNYRTL